MHRRMPRGAAAVGLLCLAVAAPLHAQELSYVGSLEASSGSYIFTGRTHTFALYTGGSLRAGRFGVSASLPLVAQNSGAVSIVGRGLFPTGGPDHSALRGRTSGHRVPMGRHGGSGSSTGAAVDAVRAPDAYRLSLGDPFVSGAVTLHEAWDVLRSVDLMGSLKIPMADPASGVGTGAWDYAAGASVTLGGNSVLVFGDLSYGWYGDLPDLELEDGVRYGIGLGAPLTDRTSVLASFSGAAAIVEGVAPSAALSLAANHSGWPGRSLTAGLSIGLTESAAAVSVFLGWRARLRADPTVVP